MKLNESSTFGDISLLCWLCDGGGRQQFALKWRRETFLSRSFFPPLLFSLFFVGLFMFVSAGGEEVEGENEM